MDQVPEDAARRRGIEVLITGEFDDVTSMTVEISAAMTHVARASAVLVDLSSMGQAIRDVTAAKRQSSGRSRNQFAYTHRRKKC